MNELKWPVRGLEHIALHPGSVVVFAAPRRTGKTTFAADLAVRWALLGHRVALAVPETDPIGFLFRHGCSESAAERAGRNLLVLNALPLTTDAIANAANMIAADAIIIDDLQFLRYGIHGDTIAEIASKLGCVVVATCGRNPMIDCIVDSTAAIRVNAMPKIGRRCSDG